MLTVQTLFPKNYKPCPSMPHRKQRPIYTDKEVLAALESCAGNVMDAAASLSISHSLVARVARRNGVYDQSAQRLPSGGGRKKASVDLARFDALVADGMTRQEAAREMGVHIETINRRRRERRMEQSP